MDGKKLYELVAKDPVLKAHFIGVFAADELPHHMQVGTGLIVNCCKRELPGEHWLALFQSTRNKVEFFDSFGNTPSTYGLKIKSGQLDQWNNIQLQNLFSTVCGLYCIFYLSRRVRGNHMSTIVNIFSEHNTVFNDELVRKKICKYFDLVK